MRQIKYHKLLFFPELNTAFILNPNVTKFQGVCSNSTDFFIRDLATRKRKMVRKTLEFLFDGERNRHIFVIL
jgi:hypothetical protein